MRQNNGLIILAETPWIFISIIILLDVKLEMICNSFRRFKMEKIYVTLIFKRGFLNSTLVRFIVTKLYIPYRPTNLFLPFLPTAFVRSVLSCSFVSFSSTTVVALYQVS